MQQMYNIKCSDVLVAKTSHVAEPRIKKQGKGARLLRKNGMCRKAQMQEYIKAGAIPTVE